MPDITFYEEGSKHTCSLTRGKRRKGGKDRHAALGEEQLVISGAAGEQKEGEVFQAWRLTRLITASSRRPRTGMKRALNWEGPR